MSKKERSIKEIAKQYADTLKDTSAISESAKKAFAGGLFTKPQWLKDKDSEVKNGSN